MAADAARVFQSPRPVFAALRDCLAARGRKPAGAGLSPSSILAGIAAILLAPETGRLDWTRAWSTTALAVLAVLVFLTGAIYGAFAYWIGGAFLYVGLRGAGSQGTYRRARHILAFAAVPTVLGLLVVWPARLARLRRRTRSARAGTTTGIGPLLFDLAEGAFVALVARPAGLRDRGRRALARCCAAGVAVALAVLAIFVLTFPFVLAASAS